MIRTQFYFKARRLPVFLAILALFLAACSRGGPTSTVKPEPSLQSTASPTEQTALPPTPVQPSPTPLPLAARVNGLEITLAEYQAELGLYKAAVGKDLAPEDMKRVVDDLINEALLAQAAAEKGFVVDDTLLQERQKRLTEQLGGEQALNDWIVSHGYDPQSFRQALERSIEASWMRDQIVAGVPKTAEQVHARQILLYNSDEANQVLAQLQAGNDFGNLADKYDPVTGGDLGWFPRGYLPDPKIEEAAFSLQPGEHSPVIETPAGFHIILVIERDPQHPLGAEALLVLQAQAVQDWLAAQRSQADIQILSP